MKSIKSSLVSQLGKSGAQAEDRLADIGEMADNIKCDTIGLSKTRVAKKITLAWVLVRKIVL